MAKNSIQSQYKTSDKQAIMLNRLMTAIQDSNVSLSPYASDTRKRDMDLLLFSRSDPLIASVLSSVVLRDINRGWMLRGSVGKVRKTARNLHSVNNGSGWRNFISKLSTSYYSTNVGFSAEIGTLRNGSPATMWSFDPTTVRLINGKKSGLEYHPRRFDSKVHQLNRGQYIHSNSMPSVEEDMYDAGFCAVERALTMVRITIGLFQYQLEKLGVAPPKGIALFKGIMKEDYDQALDDADEDALNEDIQVFNDIIALFTNQLKAEIELIGFSQLPEQFDLKDFIDIVMQTYALAFGYPVSEVWSISSGAFSNQGEMKVQQTQATEKGELAFALALQEQLTSYFIPSSVNFSFDTRNDSGDLIKAEMEQKKIEAISTLYSAGRVATAEREDPLISKEQALELLASWDIIPNEWTTTEDNSVTFDLKETREAVRTDPYIVSRALSHPDEPIIEYRWDAMGTVVGGINMVNDDRNHTLARFLGQGYTPSGQYRLLYSSGAEMTRKRNY